MANPETPFVAGDDLSEADAKLLETEAQAMVSRGDAQDAKRARQMVRQAWKTGMTAAALTAAVAAPGGPKGHTGRPAGDKE